MNNSIVSPTNTFTTDTAPAIPPTRARTCTPTYIRTRFRTSVSVPHSTTSSLFFTNLSSTICQQLTTQHPTMVIHVHRPSLLVCTPNRSLYSYNNNNKNSNNNNTKNTFMRCWYQQYFRRPPSYRWGGDVDSDNIVLLIVVLNLVVFILCEVISHTGNRQLIQEHFGASLFNLRQGRIHTLLTATFAHVDMFHCLFNMGALYFLGVSLARSIGSFPFLVLYIGGGLCSTTTTMGINYYRRKKSINPYQKEKYLYSSTMGASGSVMSVLTLFGLMAPFQPVVINFIITLPACVVVGCYVLYDLYGATNPSGRTNHIGHLAGSALGALAFILRRGRIF